MYNPGEFPEYIIKCVKCQDTGYVFFKKEFVEHNGEAVLCLCRCSTGLKLDEATERLPRYDNLMGDFVDKFPIDLFNPTKQDGTSEMKCRIAWWTKFKNNSREYWLKKR